MAFYAGKFLETPDLEGFDNLKKEELVLLAKHLKLDFRISMRKQIIKNLVIDKLVDAEILGEEALELKVENVDAIKLQQLELEHELTLKQLENEVKLKQLEKEKEERQAELEMRERVEIEKMKIEMTKEESNTKFQSKLEHFNFDAAKNIRMVPKFCEKIVDKFFPQFEKIAQNLKGGLTGRVV